MTKGCDETLSETLSAAINRLILIKTANKIAVFKRGTKNDLSTSTYSDAHAESVNEVKNLIRAATVTELMEDHELVEKLIQEQEDEKCE